MESLSNATFWLAIAAAGISSLLYGAHVLGLRLVMRRLSTPVGEGPVVATLERSGDNGWTDPVGRAATGSSWLVLALLLVSIAARWQAAGHPPWSNMYEFTVAFAAGILAFYVIFERTYSVREGRQSARTVGMLVLPVVLAMLAITAAFFPSDVRPLVPALQNNNLLAIHVAFMVLAYGALSVSFATAVLYIAQGGKKNRFPRLPKARLLDELGYKAVMIGFPLLAAGIALGAYWANSAWGRYWGWDPKETSALLTLLVYGVYLHMRGVRKWSGVPAAWVLIIGFGAIMFTYFVVNLWIDGLHSYAGV